MDDLEIKFEIFAVRDTLDGQRHILLDLLRIVEIADDDCEGLDHLVLQSIRHTGSF
jgi:hypothetical protein